MSLRICRKLAARLLQEGVIAEKSGGWLVMRDGVFVEETDDPAKAQGCWVQGERLPEARCRWCLRVWSPEPGRMEIDAFANEAGQWRPCALEMVEA